jgi:glycerol-3-phosphate dehydrogenase
MCKKNVVEPPFLLSSRGGNRVIFDVVVIGAGVTGALAARELSKYDLDICLLEREYDAAMGTSKANSAIVHAGYDAKPGSLKASLNVRGNELMGEVTDQLGVAFKRTGSLVLAFNEEDRATLKKLLSQGELNGVKGMSAISQKALREMEPNVSENAVEGLLAETAGIVCPYELTIGAVENAVKNGVKLKLGFEVCSIKQKDGLFSLSNGKEEVICRYIVNAAGLYADKISKMAGAEDFEIMPRKGEYLLLDKNQGNTVNRVIFQVPSALGKGILVTPTVDGNLLIGPNANDTGDREDKATTTEGLEEVISGALKSVPDLNLRGVITSFAGLRARPSTGDFIIEVSKKVKGFINMAGIESPGLTAAPAIAEYAVELLENEGLKLVPRIDFDPVRKHIKKFVDMSEEEINQAVKDNPMYGRIVCRCEKVTEGEIVECIRRPAGARTLDGVKRRTRAGMGRCQGGFCTPRVVEILSRELGIPMDRVSKSGGKSYLLEGRTK